MRQRGLVVAVAFLMAMGATAAVFLYVRGVRDEAKTGGALVTVIVPAEDIPAGSDLNPLIDQGKFKESAVPEDALVEGAVSTLEQLRGQTTTSAILANEQIPANRLSSGTLPGGALGISEGYKAVSVKLEAEQVTGDALQRGSHVTVYATFDDVTLIDGTLQQILRGESQTRQDIGDFTITLVPDTRVLGVVSPGAEAGASVDESFLVTLELTPQDAQNLVFAQETGDVWLALLPPGEKGSTEPPTELSQLLLRSK
ncbi:MAG: Flp pilus assembly protein CpaB [Actinobacteria bacterium]|nr:Flp pilus assembly protein CpaB [Actinomycetota bacterium]